MASTRAKVEWVLLGQSGFSTAAVIAQVERMCSSPAFDDKESRRGLLKYLVSEALAGRVPQPADIAPILGKAAFNSRETNVRTAVNRLRESMKEHYLQHAKRDETIRLVIPAKSYIVFAPRHSAAAPGMDIPAAASILEPPESSECYQRFLIRGRIDSLDPDLRVWLVVLASDGFYYPQCRVSRRSPSWEYEVRIGRMQWGETDGVEFSVFLVAIDADGDFDLYGYMKRNGDGYGTRLPSDAQVLDTRRVIRRDIRPGGPTTDRLPPKGAA